MKKRYPSCILATCCVPWNNDGTLAEEIFRREIRNLRDNLTRHLYLFGTAGEGHEVTDRQYDLIIRIFREETSAPENHPMIGVISLSLGSVIERIERARDLGFRSFQISLPCWGALNDQEMMNFFQETCGRFTDCSFLHYNLMRVKRLITPDEYAKLSKEFPNLVATKNSTDSMDRIVGLMTKAPELQHFYTETGFGYGAQMGECGFLISVASMNFQLGRAYFEAGQSEDKRKLLAMQLELKHLTNNLINFVGTTAHMDGAYDKFFCRMHDPKFPLRLLSPYSTFSDETFANFVKFAREKYPNWIS